MPTTTLHHTSASSAADVSKLLTNDWWTYNSKL